MASLAELLKSNNNTGSKEFTFDSFVKNVNKYIDTEIIGENKFRITSALRGSKFIEAKEATYSTGRKGIEVHFTDPLNTKSEYPLVIRLMSPLDENLSDSARGVAASQIANILSACTHEDYRSEAKAKEIEFNTLDECIKILNDKCSDSKEFYLKVRVRAAQGKIVGSGAFLNLSIDTDKGSYWISKTKEDMVPSIDSILEFEWVSRNATAAVTESFTPDDDLPF